MLLSTVGVAQKKNADYRLLLQKTATPVRIDGRADDVAWQQATAATDFHMVLPMDTSRARARTDVRMAYDDNFLYLLAECYHAAPGPYVVESLRRDFSFGKNDNFLLFMDPFDDQTNGFSFGANAAGAQWDGLMYDGGKVDLSWDNKWVSEVKNDAEKWTFEAAIPFKTLRYKLGITEWGINFSRLDLKTAEKSSWTPVPRQFPTASLAYTGVLVWDEPPPRVGNNVSIIPYALGGMRRDFRQENGGNNYRGDVGVDAKVAITSSLNLDLTVNPDFSQVEVDQQVTNLDRFELFFPERRQFFLENGDLLANFGYPTIRPFFSRRIGLGVPIRFGARLSGKFNKNWRINLLNMQTSRVEEDGRPAQNFAAATVQRRVFARSSIGIIAVDKTSLNYQLDGNPDNPTYSRYNRNLGAEYNIASANNQWTGKVVYLRSMQPDGPDNNWVHAANLQYDSRHWTLGWQHEYVGRGYTAEVGFVPRRAYVRLKPELSYRFLPKNSPVVSHGPSVGTEYFLNESFRQTDNESFAFYSALFQNRSEAAVWVGRNYVQLLQAFDPTNARGDTLTTGSQHRWRAWGTEYTSTPNSLFTYAFSTRYGGYYADGRRLNVTTELGYRFQPYVSIAVRSSYNNILLPEPWNRTTFWLVGPRLDVTMTNKLFVTAFMQYNEQLENINLNARLQWRYQPASDLFVVYTDNYLPAPFGVRNRALVVKLTYWWNV